jgi:acyl carrier protein
MTISTRTPEGLPFGCPICGRSAMIEPSMGTGDAVCPSCGHLIWWFRNQIASRTRMEPKIVAIELRFDESGLDSLDIVELIMELEGEFGIYLPEDEAERIRTIEDAIRAVNEARRRRSELQT